MLTPEEILTSDTVAVTWGYRVLGIEAGWIMPVVVCLSTLGALNGSMLTGGRLPFVAARRGHMPQVEAFDNKVVNRTVVLIYTFYRFLPWQP